MNDLISIIVPVYNTGKYLDACISSIVKQDYPNTEIILVDDGSTDANTLEKCSELERKYSKVVLLHKPNGGSASARNYGISHAKGCFIGFVDSDDVVDANMYSTLYSMLKSDQTQLAVCGLATHERDTVSYTDDAIVSKCYSNEEFMHFFLLGHWHSACTSLYAKSLFDKVSFPENELNEDYMLNYWIFKNQERVSVTNAPLYHYLRRSGSNTNTPKNLKSLDWIKHTELVLSEMIANPSLCHEAEYQYLYSNIVLANSSLLTLARMKSDEASELYKIVTGNLRHNWTMLRRNPFFTMKYRVMSTLMTLMPSAYKFIIVNCIKLKNAL